jgi:hypothetical protein
MKIARKEGGEYADCIVKHFDLFDYEDDKNDKVLFWGWNSIFDDELKNKYEDFSKKYFINIVQPCEIMNDPNELKSQLYFDEVFTICPYTAKMLNSSETGNTIYTPICVPYRQKYFEKYRNITPQDKERDVIYYGQFHNELYSDLIKSISKFNYAFSTISFHGQSNDTVQLITHYNLTSQEKWDLLSKCRINVGFNLLFLNVQQLNALKAFPNIQSYKNIDVSIRKAIIPQMKTRMVEAAASKTLMLMYKDQWNVIENWFEEGKHFLYWENFEQLESMIEEISKNYEKYWHIVEAAYDKVQEYSIESLMDRINNQSI